jgi:hypothetical protein
MHGYCVVLSSLQSRKPPREVFQRNHPITTIAVGVSTAVEVSIEPDTATLLAFVNKIVTTF